jgi:hypothetical protein
MSKSSGFLDAQAGKARRIGFMVAAALAAVTILVVFGSIFAFFMPWVANPGEGPGYAFPDTHRWHDAQYGAHTAILLGGSALLLLLRRTRTPILMQFFVLASIVYTVLGTISGHPETVIALVIAVILVLLYPDRRSLLTFGPRQWSFPLLAVAILAAAIAMPYAIDMFRMQLNHVAGDEHGEFGHWAMALILLINLLLAGVMAATRRPGSGTLGVLAGLAFIYLGVAALTSRDAGGFPPPGIWSTFPAVLSMLAGIGYIGAALMDERLAAMLPTRAKTAT